jgi:hypothetical protein
MPLPIHSPIQTFADLALKARRQHIDDEYSDELSDAMEKLAPNGAARNSGAREATELRLKAEKLQKLVLARAETLIEAYQSHNTRVDEAEILRQIGSFRSQTAGGMVSGYQGQSTEVAARTGRHDAALSAKVASFQCELERKGHAAETEARLLIKKVVLTKPKESTVPNQVHNEYHLHGPNSRVTINGNDQSVNTVTVQPDELFTKLRAELMATVPEGDEREQILQRLAALREAQGTSAFSERLGNFMAFAANWTTVITPFLPALAEMARQVLS